MAGFSPHSDGTPPARRNRPETPLAPPLPEAETLSREEIQALADKHGITLPDQPLSPGHHADRQRDQELKAGTPQVQQVRDIW